jgi:DNA repair protein RecO (recombination protein O)
VKQLQTRGIVLSRTDYGEADRIITVLTPEQGKLRLMARGVRKPKSKLAGGIELFSISDLTFIRGRGDIGTLISSRLDKHYGRIVQDIGRVQLGYDLIKLLNRSTEDEPEPEYFDVMSQALQALDEPDVEPALTRSWFDAQLLRLAGHAPNLRTAADGSALQPDAAYTFDPEHMAFVSRKQGSYDAGHIKLLRLLFSDHPPQEIAKVGGVYAALSAAAPLLRTMSQAQGLAYS